jgi:hypothetical protein
MPCGRQRKLALIAERSGISVIRGEHFVQNFGHKTLLELSAGTDPSDLRSG